MSVDAMLTRVAAATAVEPGLGANPPKGPAKPMRRVPGVEAREWTLPGFGPMTRISTSLGDTPVQALRERDMVRTRNGDYKPIVWLDRIMLDEEFLSLHPDALPVLIRKDSLGRGVPNHDVYLAPNQQIDPRATKIAESHDTARALLGRPGVIRKAEASYSYTLFHFGEPQVIRASNMYVHVFP